MEIRPRFSIGQTVVNKVSKKGAHEPVTCGPYEKMEIRSMSRIGNDYWYVCGEEGYEFAEDELISLTEYRNQEGRSNVLL